MSDQTDPKLPSADRVARRALVLSAIACRGCVDNDHAHARQASDLARRTHEWVLSMNLENELTAWEAGLLVAPFGTLSDPDRINASWLSEAAVVLAWALGVGDLPAFDEQCDPAEVASRIGFLNDIEKSVLRMPALRSREQMLDYNEFIYHVHWRLRDFSLVNKPFDFEGRARKSWGDPLHRHGLKLAGKDIAIGGVPLSEAPENDRHRVTSITEERHRASNWLIGYASEDFHEVTTDT